MENSILLTLPKWQLMRTWFLCKTMILSWRGRNFGWLLLLSKAGQNDFRPGSSSPVAGSKNIWTFCSLYKWIWTLANRYVSFSFNKWYWFFFFWKPTRQAKLYCIMLYLLGEILIIILGFTIIFYSQLEHFKTEQ